MVRVRQPGLLLGEWACLAALGQGRLHGFAIARRLAPDGDLGRIWTLSRPLTYRALGTLVEQGLVRAAASEPGAGPNRTVMAITAKGRRALDAWLAGPVAHPRDVRGELLLKLVVRDGLGLGRQPLVNAQLAVFEAMREQRHAEQDEAPDDPVRRWRLEFVEAALRFLRSL